MTHTTSGLPVNARVLQKATTFIRPEDDRTSDRVDLFSIERGRKRTYKGFQYFCQGHDREGGNLVEHTFSCLTISRTSHWTVSEYSLLNTRLIEAEYSRQVNIPKSVKKRKSSV